MSKNQEIVSAMFQSDTFSKWLGIEILSSGLGCCKLKMTITKDMLNGFGMAHGGISYSFADSALAFASNSHGQKSVSIETSISHLLPLKLNDVIIAEAKEEHCSNKIGVYHISVTRESDNQQVALFKGTVYRTSKQWE